MEDRINDILHKLNIKREVWHGEKVNGGSCRRLMKNHVENQVKSKMHL